MSRVPGFLRRLVWGQLRLRVLLAVVSVTLLTLVVFDVVAVTALRSYLISQTDTTLREAAQHNAGLLADVSASTLRDRTLGLRQPEIAPPETYQHDLPDFGETQGTYTSEYTAEHGKTMALSVFDPVLSSTPTDQALRALPLNGQAQTLPSMDGSRLVRVLATPASGGRVETSVRMDAVDQTTARMRLIVAVGSGTAMVVIAAAVFWLLRRGLRPIETMAGQADRVTAGDLTDRVTPQDVRSEVGRLGAALNGMLARIETAMHEREASQEQMRRFFADAGHELRTPLASLRANAELYQQGALTADTEVDEVMWRITVEARRMSGLVDDMLRLARLEQHPTLEREPVAVGELVSGCVDRIRVAAPGRRWDTTIAANVITVGDEELLRRAVDNLLGNVLAHTPTDTVATVTLAERDGTIEIEVADNGPGVPIERLPFIFDRFYRADNTTTRPGTGLGLAIVTQIATIHNGTVTAEPNKPHGLRIRIALTTDDPAN